MGQNGKPVSGAHITAQGVGFPAEGVTDANGEVTISIFNRPGARPRYIFVQPGKNYWTRYINSPDVSADQVNEIRVRSLADTMPQFPDSFTFGWGQVQMGLDQFPDELTGKGVKIAIIDSGADNTHPLLHHILKGEDYTDGTQPGSWANDIVTHGSHCAGVITAQSDASLKWRGFAPEAEIHVLKVFPGGRFDSLLKAIDYCITHEIDVVNMSLGSDQKSEAVEQKLEDARDNGVLCIVAAGNSGGPVQYPASSTYVIAVSAIGKLGLFSEDSWDSQTITQSLVAPDGIFSPNFTCFGREVDVCAPGVAVISTVPGSSFEPQSGTSMAAPHVTGFAALLLAHHPLFKSGPLAGRSSQRSEVLGKLIKSTCVPYNQYFGFDRTGAGMPNLQSLIQAMRATVVPVSAQPESQTQQSSQTPTASAQNVNTLASQITPQGIMGSELGGLLGGYGGTFLGQSQLGRQFGSYLGGLLPFQAGPQLAPQGIFGSQLGSMLGGLGSGLWGQGQAANQLGGAVGNFLPFQAGPQLASQAAFGSQLGNMLGGLGGHLSGQGQAGSQLGGALGNFLPFQAGPQLISQGPFGG
jgi:subtilisin family serine protease